ncbi:MAG TPA: alpha/beta fold hydrolase [Bryobacteraceae bacterium]
MARRIETYFVPGPAGRLEALMEAPEEGEPRFAAVVCHPHPLHGGTMHNKVVFRLARGLRRAGAVVLRFNFRGVGASEGEHAHMVGEVEDARAALDWLRARYPELGFALAGFSFGARVIMTLGCQVESAVFLMAAGFPTRGDAVTWGAVHRLEHCRTPKIFLQSTNDQFGPRGEFKEAYAKFAEPKKVIWIESADHFFAGALEELEEQVREAAGSGDTIRSEPA